MRLPKNIRICGKNYSVKMDKSKMGGRFSTGRMEIEIGTKYNNFEQIFENFLHEIAEAVLIENGCCYGNVDNNYEERIFVMTHKEFNGVFVDLASALLPIVLSKGVAHE